MTVGIFKKLFGSRFAEIAFAMHARDGIDEMKELTKEFTLLIEKSSIDTPNIDTLKRYMG